MGRLIPAGTGLPMYKKLGISAMDDGCALQEGEQPELPMPEKISEKILDIETTN